jgi:DNA polymerase III epsilon subunit-like protein
MREKMNDEIPEDIYKEYEKDQDFNMVHTNDNLICAIDVETTGLDPEKHDLTEVAVIPLNHLFEPNKKYRPFNPILQPKQPENANKRALTLSGFKLAELMLNGHDPWRAADAFEEWFHKLGLPPQKKIIPLAHNWPFDRMFLRQWLGPLTFDHIFHPHYRDTMTIASFLNDRAYDRSDKFYPHPKLSLGALCVQMSIENRRAHRAIYDCLATAEVYKKFVTRMTI